MRTILTLTGPSCSGKSTLEKMLKQAGFENVISTTTRPMREGEVNGKSYYFIDKSEFKRLDACGAFVETVHFNGNYYGVSAKEVERVFAMNRPVVVVVEPEGLRQIREYAAKNGWRHIAVFINNPPEVIAHRFLERMLSDFTLALGKGTAGAILDTYSKRLGVMMGDETKWADQEAAKADVNLLWFNEENSKTVVDELIRLTYSPAYTGGNDSGKSTATAPEPA
jgi:guanylate kinase